MSLRKREKIQEVPRKSGLDPARMKSFFHEIGEFSPKTKSQFHAPARALETG